MLTLQQNYWYGWKQRGGGEEHHGRLMPLWVDERIQEREVKHNSSLLSDKDGDSILLQQSERLLVPEASGHSL